MTKLIALVAIYTLLLGGLPLLLMAGCFFAGVSGCYLP